MVGLSAGVETRTSRAALNRVFDEDNTAINLMTLSRTAAPLGCRVNLQIVAAR